MCVGEVLRRGEPVVSFARPFFISRCSSVGGVRRGWGPVARPELARLARWVRGEYMEPRKTLSDFMECTHEQKILKVY